MLNFIPLGSYVISEPKKPDECISWMLINYIACYSVKDLLVASEDDVQKIQLARTLKSCFNNYQGDKGDYEQLVALVEKEGLQIPVYE